MDETKEENLAVKFQKSVAAIPEDVLASREIIAAIDCRSDLNKRVRELRNAGPGQKRTLTILEQHLLPGFPAKDRHELEWRLNQFLLGSGMRFKRTELHHNPAWKLCQE